jgi:transcription initiation factor IIF auxiliary subunit
MKEIEVLDEAIEKFAFYVDHCSFPKDNIHQDWSVVVDHSLYDFHV